MAKILTVTSGKGGVGKTNFSVNMAVYLAQLGHKTCLFDADLGLANINILLGIYPEYNLEDVIDGKKKLKDIIIHDKSGIDIIPGSSGVAKMEVLSTTQLNDLADAFKELKDYDFVVFDTSAGIAKNVIAFCMNASEVLLVITPEPTSLTDAYALMKILSLNGFKQTAKVVVNQSKNPKTAQIAYTKLKDTVRKFLGIQLAALGTIVSDPRVIEAVAAQRPFITLYPNTQAAKNIRMVVDNLLNQSAASENTFAMDTFWNRCIDILTVPLKMPVRKSDASPKGEAPPMANSSVVVATHQKALRAAAEDADRPAVIVPLPPGIDNSRLLEKLIEKVASISEELSGIRKAFEKGALTGFTSGTTADGPGQAHPLIPLDFEAFLAEQKAEGENEIS